MTNDTAPPRDDSPRFGRTNSAEEGLVERLLGAAGPGPQIPDGGADRVKAAIRSSWKDEVAITTRQRRRLWAGGLAAVAAVLIGVLAIPFVQRSGVGPAPDSITITAVDGNLEVTPPGSKAALLGPNDAGSIVPEGSLLRTRTDQRAALRLNGGQSLRLDRDTLVRLDSGRSLALDSGAVYISSEVDGEPGIEVRTALGTAAEIGTQFEVRLQPDTLNVSVREGFVSLTRGDDEYQIDHGISLSIDAGGSVTTAPITPYDPAWEWTQQIAPAFEIDGESALAFLTWVSSETGLSVRYADREVERLAATTLVHGSLAGLTPSETPVAVLPACGLRAIAEPGAILIVRAGTD